METDVVPRHPVSTQRLIEGNPGNMPNAISELDAMLGRYSKNDRNIALIMVIHTHPNKNPEPSSIWADMENINHLGIRGAIGLIIYGPGKYSFYDGDGSIAAGSGKLDDCLPNTRSHFDYW